MTRRPLRIARRNWSSLQAPGVESVDSAKTVLTTHYLLLTTYYSLLTTYYSLLTTYNLLESKVDMVVTAQCSAVHCALCTVQCSSLSPSLSLSSFLSQPPSASNFLSLNVHLVLVKLHLYFGQIHTKLLGDTELLEWPVAIWPSDQHLLSPSYPNPFPCPRLQRRDDRMGCKAHWWRTRRSYLLVTSY